jgi:hypothetical protein
LLDALSNLIAFLYKSIASKKLMQDNWT